MGWKMRARHHFEDCNTPSVRSKHRKELERKLDVSFIESVNDLPTEEWFMEKEGRLVKVFIRKSKPKEEQERETEWEKIRKQKDRRRRRRLAAEKKKEELRKREEKIPLQLSA
jgi:hypothetical protein